MNPLRLAWKKLSDIELRSWVVALSALGVAGFALFATLGLRGAANSLELAADRMGADIVVVPAGAETKLEGALLTGVPAQFWMPAENVAKLRPSPGLRPSLPGLPHDPGRRLVLFGVRDVHDRLRSGDRLHGAALAGQAGALRIGTQ